MTAVPARAPRSVGAAALTALAVAATLALLPFLQTLSTLATTFTRAEPSYIPQILAVEGPRIVLVPLAVGIVAFVAFGAVAPIRGSFRMAQVVRRGFVTAAVALVIAALVATCVGVLTALAGIGPNALSTSAGTVLRILGNAIVSELLGQLGGQLTVLIVVPLGALLLWGWLRREVSSAPASAAAAPISPEV